LKHADEVQKLKQAVIVVKMESAFMTRMTEAVLSTNYVLTSMAQFSQITLTPGPSSKQKSKGNLPFGTKQRVYDAFLAVASLSEPQHTIYGF